MGIKVRRIRTLTLCASLLSTPALSADPGLQATIAPGFDQEIRSCAQRNNTHTTLKQRQLVQVSSEDGWVRESTRMMYLKRFADDHVKILFEVTAPASEAGLKVLVDKKGDADPVVHVYSPETGRARRMMSSGASHSVLGTDLTFEDALYFQTLGDAAVTRRTEDAVIDGHPVFVLQSFPSGQRSAYSRIEAAVDKALCLPLRVDFHAPNGSLAKRFEADLSRTQSVDGQYFPLASVMHNFAQRSKSEFTIQSMEAGIELHDRLFSLKAIRKGH